MQVRVVGWHFFCEGGAVCDDCGKPASVCVLEMPDGFQDFSLCSECLKKYEVASDAIDEAFRRAGF